MNEPLFQVKSRVDFGEFITKGKTYNVMKEKYDMYMIEPDNVGLKFVIDKEDTDRLEPLKNVNAIAIEYEPNTVYILPLPQTASDNPLTSEQKVILFLYNKLQSETEIK